MGGDHYRLVDGGLGSPVTDPSPRDRVTSGDSSVSEGDRHGTTESSIQSLSPEYRRLTDV